MGRWVRYRERSAKTLVARLVGLVCLAIGLASASDIAVSGKSASDAVAATFEQQIKPFLAAYCT